MSATAALILLVEAATACGAVAPTGPDGRADVLPAILDVEAQPLDLSTPAPAAMPFDAAPETDRPDADPAVEQCALAPVAIA